MRTKLVNFTLLAALGLAPAARADEMAHLKCDDHPPVRRAEGVAVRTAHQEQVKNRSGQGGLQVDLQPSPGGGECASTATARGKAAAAVGAIQYDGQMHCSGVLVAPSTVLTAAHCVRNFDIHKMEFLVGDDLGNPIQRAGVLDTGYHKHYDPSRFGVNDLAYLHLDHLITAVAPVKYMTMPLKGIPKQSLVHVGFGIAGTQPGVRRCVDIPVAGTCEDSFTAETPGLNNCSGDSGGGAFYDQGGEINLSGITTWGDSLCQEFGVSLDVGAYEETIGSWIGAAEKNLSPAIWEIKARKLASPFAVREIQSVLSKLPVPDRQEVFRSSYRERWVDSTAQIHRPSVSSKLRYPDSCDVFLEDGDLKILLLGLEHGCEIPLNSQVRFKGFLYAYQDNYFEVLAPELVSHLPIPQYTGSFRLLSVASQRRTERRTHDFRLESEHGYWSGRKEVCEPVVIEGPWRLDRTQSILVSKAWQDDGHSGAGEPTRLSDSGFCVPLWAQGYGGVRELGVTIDAGNKGVISGGISYGVVREEEVANDLDVQSGEIAKGVPLRISLPDPAGSYELRLKLANGREIVSRQSHREPGVVIDWDRHGGVVNLSVD
jgi:Trypsin